jgi:hypothetical protein
MLYKKCSAAVVLFLSMCSVIISCNADLVNAPEVVLMRDTDANFKETCSVRMYLPIVDQIITENISSLASEECKLSSGEVVMATTKQAKSQKSEYWKYSEECRHAGGIFVITVEDNELLRKLCKLHAKALNKIKQERYVVGSNPSTNIWEPDILNLPADGKPSVADNRQDISVVIEVNKERQCIASFFDHRVK